MYFFGSSGKFVDPSSRFAGVYMKFKAPPGGPRVHYAVLGHFLIIQTAAELLGVALAVSIALRVANIPAVCAQCRT